MRNLVLAFGLIACAGGAPPAEKPPEPAKVEAAPESPKTGENVAADPMAMTKPPEGAKVSFTSPADGAEVTSPVKLVFAVEGMTVKPAGELETGTGHHHLLIDAEPVAWGVAVPADANHIHYGKGQTEAEVELAPGEHTLSLQFADGAHRSYGETMTTSIKITVK